MGTVREEFARLGNEVSELKTTNASAIALLNGIAEKLRDMAANNVSAEELAAFADTLDSETNTLAAAVTANTPSEGQPQA